jgi:hypothetical protein
LGHDWKDLIDQLPGWEEGLASLNPHIVIEQTEIESPHVTQRIKSCLLKWEKNCRHLGVVNRVSIIKVLVQMARIDVVEEIEMLD